MSFNYTSILTSFIISLSSFAQSNNLNEAQSISVDFYYDSIAVRPEGLETIESICEKFETKAPDISTLKIILIPVYNIEEVEKNRFIGVSRAKRVQELLIGGYAVLRDKIMIKDLGAFDSLFHLCSGSFLPTLTSGTFKPQVMIAFE